MTDLQPGDRVHVHGHWNWPDDCTGVVALPPTTVRSFAVDEPWQGHLRTLRTLKGMITFVWIVFDVPQHDGDGDGPYPAGEVELEYVARVESPSR